MTEGTHARRIIGLLKQRPGLDDDEIARALDIYPRQTVNQICRRLAASGVLRRERGAGGKIINLLGNASAAIRAPAARPVPAPDRRTSPRRLSRRDIVPTDLARTMLIIPCSGAKRDRFKDAEPGPAITHGLPADLVSELLAARAHVRKHVPFDETDLVPAWQRYNGAFYQAGRRAIGDLVHIGAHVVILSGGYGVILATEPIGIYETRLKPSWWPSGIIQRTLMAYARRHEIASVRAVVSSTGPYVNLLRQVRWQDAAVDDVLLITPHPEPGAMRRSPATQGEALVALRDGTLTTDWHSSYGLGLTCRE